jgi:chemotaxis protein CheZ
MAEPRQVFRIEETAAARRSRNADGALASPYHSEIMQALGALRTAMAAPALAAKPGGAERGTTDRLGIEAAHLTRIAHELDAVVNGTSEATQKVLAAAEEIDQLANNLSAALKGKIEQGLAQDIRDLVIRIFEACNFQDLIGQRVTKVMATLKLIEDHINRVLVEIKDAPPAPWRDEAAEQYLHGPRLDSDHGHVTQAEIDAMFGSA